MQGMPNVPHQLPRDIDALQALLADQAARNTRLEQENVRLNAKVLSLQKQLNLAIAHRYAASSEKLSPDQIRLFNEAEVDATLEGDDIAETDLGQYLSVVRAVALVLRDLMDNIYTGQGVRQRLAAALLAGVGWNLNSLIHLGLDADQSVSFSLVK